MFHLIAALVTTLAGLAAARWAWRSRRSVRVGDHPHCRQCNRDLFALADAARCPECGADLARPNAVATGAATSDRPAQVAGGAVAAVLLLVALSQWKAVDWVGTRLRLSPTSWLIGDVGRGGKSASEAALELNARLQDGAYEGEDAQAVVEALGPFALSFRPVVRAGGYLPYDVTYTSRVMVSLPYGQSGGNRVELSERLARYRWGDGPWTETGHHWQGRQVLHWEARVLRELRLPHDLPAGASTLEVEHAYRLVRRDPQPSSRFDPKPGTRIAEWTRRFKANVTAVPAQGEDVEFVTSPADRDVRASLRVVSVPGWGGPRAIPPARPAIMVYTRNGRWAGVLGFEVVRPPVAVAFEVFLREPDGTEVPLGTIMGAAGQHMASSFRLPGGLLAAWERDRPATVDLILRPSAAVARSSPHLLKVSGDTITFERIPVVVEE